jgi:uncharacterized membrane protein (UPF0127 family)
MKNIWRLEGMKFKKIIFYDGEKQFSLNVNVCRGIMKAVGLMFSREENAEALIFEFSKSKNPSIHSFFCPKFLGIWLDNKNNIIQKKIVEPWLPSVKCKQSFSKLIEIPLNRRYSRIVILSSENSDFLERFKKK